MLFTYIHNITDYSRSVNFFFIPRTKIFLKYCQCRSTFALTTLCFTSLPLHSCMLTSHKSFPSGAISFLKGFRGGEWVRVGDWVWEREHLIGIRPNICSILPKRRAVSVHSVKMHTGRQRTNVRKVIILDSVGTDQNAV